MWITSKDIWDPSHTNLSKYFIEKVKQRLDSTEVISNQHKTSNGFTLIAELLNVGTMTLNRKKSNNRLISLLKESQEHKIKSSIVSDYILNAYFKDIVKEIKSKDPAVILKDEASIKAFLHRLKIHKSRLERNYLQKIKLEFTDIDFSSNLFERNAVKIDKLVDCLIPFLIYLGYSTTSIGDIAYRYIYKKKATESALHLINHLNYVTREFKFLLIIRKSNEPIIQLALDYLTDKDIEFVLFSNTDKPRKFVAPRSIKAEENCIEFIHSTKDPHNFLRNLYDKILKRYVTSGDKHSLQFFNDYFKNVYWRFSRAEDRYEKSTIKLDAINVLERRSTLRFTLEKVTRDNGSLKYHYNDILPRADFIQESVYFYNLALGSKSIENSLSLLWTSLETLIPFRTKQTDIENIQNFVSHSLSIGSISRELMSFVSRFIETNAVNNNCLKGITVPKKDSYSVDGLVNWANWLSQDFSKISDPYKIIQPTSNLLCRQFCKLNEIYTGIHSENKTAEYWINKISTSEQLIRFQLDRIYLHRNQIVHTGKFINEYSNLWYHLEWYVGKLLSYCYVKYLTNKNCQKEDIFLELEADREQILSELVNNKTKAIKDISNLFELVLKNNWQSF